MIVVWVPGGIGMLWPVFGCLGTVTTLCTCAVGMPVYALLAPARMMTSAGALCGGHGLGAHLAHVLVRLEMVLLFAPAM